MDTEPQPIQQDLFPDLASGENGAAQKRGRAVADPDGLHAKLRRFDEFGTRSLVTRTSGVDETIPTYVNEFWTSKQRAASRLHEVSYRACFKPQLPRFFIDRLTVPGDLVYDPFLGRGTTMIEAALLGRVPVGCDLNPLSQVLVRPRLAPPQIDAVAERLDNIDFLNSAAGARSTDPEEDLLVFFHEETLLQLRSLKLHLAERERAGQIDDVDRWIQMVAVNRLTGHSNGFFSVYTMPPNQAVTAKSQRRINEKRQQSPESRDVATLILKKSRSLLRDVDDGVRERLAAIASDPRSEVLTAPASDTSEIETGSVRLVVTSPPFLDVVQYRDDNWLRCWFCDVDVGSVELSVHRNIEDWKASMSEVFVELARVLQPGGYVAFEVGEVRGGKLRLDELTLPCGRRAGLEPALVLVNDQKFTKTANCWGIDNNSKGTNTNRVVLFRRP